MSTVIRPEVTKKSQYYIPRERYYELKHFCLQYPDWQTYCNSLLPYSSVTYRETRSTSVSDPTITAVEKREQFLRYISMIDRAAKETDPVIGRFILVGVIYGLPYETLNARERVPCCKGIYYELYRRFFWILSRLRDG